MPKIMIIIASFAMTANVVYASSTNCMDKAAEKQLSGDFKTGFVTKCVRDECDASASEKKLDGAARTSFTKKCVADGMKPYCEEKYADNKLSDSAKAYFINKCQLASAPQKH